ncbi:MAG: dockerin type I repeat-containing protein [bacterium]
MNTIDGFRGGWAGLICLMLLLFASPLTAQDYVCGDADSSGVANITDAVYIIGYVFAQGAAPKPPAAGDADGSGFVGIADAVYLVQYIFAGGPVPVCPGEPSDAIIADHTVVADFPAIPLAMIETIGENFNIYYVHTSHGSQIMTGIQMVYDEDNSYDSPYFYEVSDDLGGTGDVSWVAPTRTYLDNHPECNMAMFSWCGGVSGNTEEGIGIYLAALEQLEADYPGVTFIYMTGHLDGSGPEGNLYLRNNQIRDYCNLHGKILFDFADIESYDPDGVYYPDESDYCNWCYDWCAIHTCPGCGDCAHSHCFNCYQKGKAWWWMMARIAGWES